MVSRVTNAMLRNTLLNNVNNNLGRMDRLQNQLSSGRQWAHISDNPSALIFGQAARNRITRIEHFQQSIGTAQNWLTQAESGTRELQETIGHVYEQMVSAGSTMTDTDRLNLSRVVGQMRNHFLDTLNTTFGDRFVFGGFNTPGDFAQNAPTQTRPFTMDDSGNLLFNGFNMSRFDNLSATEFNQAMTPPFEVPAIPGEPNYPGGMTEVPQLRQLNDSVIQFEVGPGIMMPVTMNGIDLIMFRTQSNDGTNSEVFRNAFSVLTEVYEGLNGDRAIQPGEPGYPGTRTITTDEMTMLINQVQDSQNHLLARTAEIGGRQRRLELIDARFEQDFINYEEMRSRAEDADMAEAIMNLRMAETIYQAALSAGARVIQPSLMDFLR
jgi:flagellar hook-associated protein 3 FlgL